MAKDKATSTWAVTSELFEGDVKLAVNVRAAGVNSENNKAVVAAIQKVVQDRLVEYGSPAGQEGTPSA